MSTPPDTGHARPIYVLIVRTNGTVETVAHPVELSEIAALLGNVTLGAHTCVGRHADRELPPIALLVDDDGYAKRLALNPLATALYGGSPVVGDVAVTADELSIPLPARYVAAVIASARRTGTLPSVLSAPAADPATTPPGVPVVGLVGPDVLGGWRVSIDRTDGAPFAVGPYPAMSSASRAAAVIRGALADAYHAGRRDERGALERAGSQG